MVRVESPFRRVPLRELIKTVRDSLDIITDPYLQVKQPMKWSNAYLELSRIVLHERQRILSPYIVHNIGKERAKNLDLLYRRILGE